MRGLWRRAGELVGCEEKQDRQQVEQEFHGRGLCPVVRNSVQHTHPVTPKSGMELAWR
jgi:hypothetical protein